MAVTRKPIAPSSARAPDALVAVGYVRRAHGLRGEVRLKHLNSSSTLLLGCKSLVLRRPEQPEDARTIAVVRSRPEKDAVLAVLEGIATRNDAEALEGLEICVPREAFPAPAADEWYIVDLVGLRAQRPDGTALGEVLDVVQYPTIDCLRVRSADGVREVPMVEPYFLSADVAGGFVLLGPLDDLELEEPKKPKIKGPKPRKPTGQPPTDDEGKPAPADDGTQE
jgi:16S rRNA processing protein RimM